MSIDKCEKAKKLLAAVGGIDDFFLDEARAADIASRTAAKAALRRRIVQYSALGAGAAASMGIAVTTTCLLIRSKRTNAKLRSIAKIKSVAKRKRLLHQE